MVWLKARRDFTFKDTSYRDGEVFAVPAIVAVQMRVLRTVEWAKAPSLKPSRKRRKAADPAPPSEPDMVVGEPLEPVIEPDDA